MKKRRLGLVRRRNLSGLIFILPWLLGFVMFYSYQLITTVRYSLSHISFPDAGGYLVTFVGLKNYRYAILEHATFVRTLVESMGNLLIDVPLIIFFSLFMAVMINRKFRGRTILRAILFLPVIMSMPVIVQVLNTSLGDIGNGISTTVEVTEQVSGLNTAYLQQFLKDIPVLADMMDYIIGAISRVYEIIRNSGVQILIFLAALQSVSPQVYEAAQIEGATGYEIFWKITFPLVSPMILTNVVYTIVSMYAQSDLITLAQNTAFGSSLNFGLSAVFSLMGVTAVALLMLVICSVVNKWVFYQA